MRAPQDDFSGTSVGVDLYKELHLLVSDIFQSADGAPSPLEPRQESLSSPCPSPRQIKNVKPFTPNKTMIVQVTGSHINQVFQSRGLKLQPLSSLLVGALSLFFPGSL